ncbi:MAG: 1-(5-phosphoribosyl)-5-[(5-phosphoribosylamino)methylideneamino]imidazole-4-carboxamide isomerase [Nitrospinae bacterium]|nr:1-(5-phosphoribosyl)-5-[(5-phosphoribosylamino)methylideneamino]imidazole-4-carboxamide isomerase [Nitrospinota bacterium]
MLLLPAVDIKEGRCVRLKQGVKGDEIHYSSKPEEMARKWEDLGARFLHVVDLDGAFEGAPKNKATVKRILDSVGIPIEIGGGIRDMEAVETYIGLGVARIILGTKAFQDLKFVEDACSRFPGKVAVGIDAKGGKVAVQGWVEVTEQKASEMAKQLEGIGVSAIIYTDISRDGMLCGPNLEATADLARGIDIPVIASGGISTREDIIRLKEIERLGVEGAIIGRALYDGSLDFREALGLAS